MNETNASITVSKDGYTEESMFFTYSNEEMEQNIINRANAESVYAPKFIPYYPALAREYNLSKTEAIIYGFIDFFTSVNSHKFYFTNEQIAKIADCSIDTASKAIVQLGKHGLISISRAVRAGGGQIRFVKPRVLDSGKSLVATKEKHRTNNNKINKNNINIYVHSFNEFWELYPKKVGRKKSEEIYTKKALGEKEEQEIMEGLRKYLRKWRDEKTDIKYIPNPTTWLSQERWTDEVVISNEQYNKNAREFEEKMSKIKEQEKREYEDYLVDDGEGGFVKFSEFGK